MKRSGGPGAPPRRHLFWRVFAHGALLIAVVTVVSGAAFHLLGDGPIWRRLHERAAILFERALDGGGAGAGGLPALLEQASFVLGGGVAVYAGDGRLLAAAGEPAPPAPEPGECGGGDHGWFRAGGQRYVMVPLPSGRGCAVIEALHVGSPEQLVGALALLLVAVALMSIPAARAIARPLERISATARRIGAGDLSARTGIDRRDELGVLARTLDEMAGRLERRIRGERELLAGASHEIRTPLSRIKVALELCDEKGATLEQLRAHLRGIAGDAAELERLVEDAMTVARLDLADGRGDLPLRRAPIRIADLAAGAAERFRDAHADRELVVEADDGGIEVDPQLARRMLDNLLDNAAKFSPANRPIELEARGAAGGGAFEVRDRGIGIPQRELELVFEPFHRTDRSRCRDTGGTGLGLTLCQRIARAHGGTIVALAREGGGTVFRVELPASGDRD